MLDELVAIVGHEHVLTDADLRAGYETDWTRRYTGSCRAVVRPVSAEQVADVVLLARRHGVPIVTQGGNTGLVGGGIPMDGALLLSTQRMRRVLDVDDLAGQVSVEAGIRLAALEVALSETGWEFGVDLGARESATLGGMAATNAGGIRVLRYGSMRANIVGLQAVLPDGNIITRMSGLVKDNTGYDLNGLLTGSEGTLGIITQLRLRLVPRWPDRIVSLITCSSWDEAVELASHARREIDGLDSLEAIDEASMNLSASTAGMERVTGGAVHVLIGWAGRGDCYASLERVIDDRPNFTAEDASGRAKLWRYREGIAESIGRIGVPHKFDVTVPIADIPDFVDEITKLVVPHRLYIFGHIGDGNLHVNVLGPPADDPDLDLAVLSAVAEFGGSISAEHGVGRMKRDYLHLSRSDEEIVTMMAIKKTLDRYSLFNPGVLFPE